MSDVNIDTISLQRLTLAPVTTILSLPVELIIEVVLHVREESPPYSSDSRSMAVVRQHQNAMLALSLFHRNWTPVARSELFRRIILKSLPSDRSRGHCSVTYLLVDYLRRGDNQRMYGKNVVSITFHDAVYSNCWSRLAHSCPNISEIYVNTERDFLGEFCLFKNLKQLNIGNQLDYDWDSVGSLSITRLSLGMVNPRHVLLASGMPLLNTLAVNCRTDAHLRSISALLPLLTSLILPSSIPYRFFCRMLEASVRLVNLTIDEANLINVGSTSAPAVIIQDRIQLLRLTGQPYHPEEDYWKHSNIISIINGSKVLKRVYLDTSSSFMRFEGEMRRRRNDLVDVCAKMGIEVWVGEEGREIEIID